MELINSKHKRVFKGLGELGPRLYMKVNKNFKAVKPLALNIS